MGAPPACAQTDSCQDGCWCCADRIWRQIEALQLRIAEYEKRLKEVSKDRETRVRRAPIELRALMAYEMQDMDREVLSVGRELALCTLDVQLDYLYLALEDEARQVRCAAMHALHSSDTVYVDGSRIATRGTGCQSTGICVARA